MDFLSYGSREQLRAIFTFIHLLNFFEINFNGRAVKLTLSIHSNVARRYIYIYKFQNYNYNFVYLNVQHLHNVQSNDESFLIFVKTSRSFQQSLCV